MSVDYYVGKNTKGREENNVALTNNHGKLKSSMSILDLLRINVCHFYHHFLDRNVSQINVNQKVILRDPCAYIFHLVSINFSETLEA